MLKNLKTNNNFKTQLKKKWANYLNRLFTKEDTQMANKHRKILNIISH